MVQGMVPDIVSNESVSEPIQIRSRQRTGHPVVVADFRPVVQYRHHYQPRHNPVEQQFIKQRKIDGNRDDRRPRMSSMIVFSLRSRSQ